ncbi:GNAT family N-acetyltransferase [Flavobacterium sp. SE-1-e]|uniref:GNAT family N-acetyltransferase n=1 Tax=Flavobacterium agrisoli TaxID=2793066 RepID=A0A934PLV8_9FLAO|nr:GNAT family N-acetyltransferase [Flavobacterium agrisoli]
MKQFTVRKYQDADFILWNDFIAKAKNATFLFHRDFMEYHKDRFEDYSLLVFEGEKLVALLPANKVGNTVFSHQGLTYGGLILQPSCKLKSIIQIFKNILNFLNQQDISSLYLKQIPSIYCSYPSDEINYLMSVLQGKTVMKHNVSVIDLRRKILISKSRKECIRRGQKLGLQIKEETQIDAFWNTLLIPNLRDKYQSKPVHSAAEIKKLMQLFPANIRHFNVYHQNELVCGTTLFITPFVAKPQYISGSDKNNLLGSLDYLYDYLIHEIAKEKDFFDFGPSHENNGLQIVENINFWKESFGAHSLVQDFYEVPTVHFNRLDRILI